MPSILTSLKITYSAPVLLVLSLSSACALVPEKEPPPPEKIAEMSQMFECVWFHHLAGDEVRSEKLIDAAIEAGEEAGMEGGEIMGVYGTARNAQREVVAERAQEIAQERGPAVSRIMQDFGREPVEPNEEDHNTALLLLYKDQCAEA